MKMLLSTIALTLSSLSHACGSSELVHIHAQQNDGAYTVDPGKKLLLFYKAPLAADGFRATLNGEDISDQFNPVDNRFGEALALSLNDGENMLELQGQVDSEECAPEDALTQRIVLLTAAR
ncbi:hypothetical protein [Litorivivens sp.]|uniref:hypothetical protein n=1 Tax=Litorivivens sp. TaxID=2020868 RepID=UPI0035615470